MIHVRALGPIKVTVNGEPAPKELVWRKHIGLVVYLARSPRRARTREHLVGLLWGDKPDDDARGSLNEALRHVRDCVEDGALGTEGGQVGLSPQGVTLDVEDLERRLAAADWAGAAALVGGEFLEGFSIPDASDFDTWLAAERRHWGGRSIEALTRRANELLNQGYSREAADLAHLALELDRDSDMAVRTAMRCLGLGGERAAALELYDAFLRRLRALGTTPDAETRALAERIRQARTPQPPTPPAPDVATRRAPLVAVGEDLGRLNALWTACRGGRAAVGIIDGDSGTGKTRLLEEVAARIRYDGGAVLVARAVEADRTVSGAALLALARGGLLDTPGIAAAPAPAIAAFVRQDPAWATRFAEAAKAPPLALGPAFTALVREAAAERPIAVVLDDAHWADDESLQALAATVRDLARAPVLVLLSANLQPAREAIDVLRSQLGRDVLGTAVRLGPLNHAALVTLVRWALPSDDDVRVDRVARRIAADSGGLALLAVELLNALAAGAELPHGDTTWPKPGQTLDSTMPVDLPGAMRAAIRVNFRRLSDAAQLVLQVIAVLGDRVDPAVIARVTKVAPDALAGALDDLEWQRWLVFETRGYSFVARVVRQVIDLDTLTSSQRRRILAAGGDQP